MNSPMQRSASDAALLESVLSPESAPFTEADIEKSRKLSRRLGRAPVAPWVARVARAFAGQTVQMQPHDGVASALFIAMASRGAERVAAK